jgi:hypothetical protein
VAGQVADGFDRVGLPIDFNFIAFHSFLDGRTNVAYADIDTGFLVQC